MTVEIKGFVEAGYEPVRNQFASNFERDDAYKELGASLAVYAGETLVVDLSAGSREPEGEAEWTADTLVNVWSTTKGVTATCVAILVDRGLIEYAKPVATYWPEFGQNGKAEITVSQLLSHQAGLPGFLEPTPLADLYDWNLVTSRLAQQVPMWRPGTKTSYHAVTFGFLAGEIVRRVSGKTIGRFLADEIAGPLGAEIYIGLPESAESRVAPVLAPKISAPFDPVQMAPEALAAVTNPEMAPTLPNSRAWRVSELPALNGHATALGVAKLYAALANGGTFNGIKLLSPNGVSTLNTVQTTQVDLLLGLAPLWRNGMSGNAGAIYGPTSNAFGHSGWGGSFGCADPDARIAIGYVMNQMGNAVVGDVRGAGLTRVIYECVLEHSDKAA